MRRAWMSGLGLVQPPASVGISTATRSAGIHPESGSGWRPLGVPCFEDSLVQDRLSQILQAIWEPEFRECSYGFRPGRSAHDALRRVADVITNERTQWVVEADIKGFFNHVSHDHLVRFLEHRIADPCLLRIIQRFLKAGVMEDGAVRGVRRVRRRVDWSHPCWPISTCTMCWICGLRSGLLDAVAAKRFSSGTVMTLSPAFNPKRTPGDFFVELRERLADFALEVEPSKTGLVRFGSAAPWNCKRDGLHRPQTFNFLGFTHYVHRSRRGYFVVGRRTERKRFNRKLQALNERLSALRVRGGTAMLCYFQQHMRGHIQYYGVSGNYRQLAAYAYFASRLLYKWLNRRSQRRSTTWARFRTSLHSRWLPPLRICHNLFPVPSWKTQAGSRMV